MLSTAIDICPVEDFPFSLIYFGGGWALLFDAGQLRVSGFGGGVGGGGGGMGWGCAHGMQKFLGQGLNLPTAETMLDP